MFVSSCGDLKGKKHQLFQRMLMIQNYEVQSYELPFSHPWFSMQSASYMTWHTFYIMMCVMSFIKLYSLFDIADRFRPCSDNIQTVNIMSVLLALHSHRTAWKGRESVSFSGPAGSKQYSLPQVTVQPFSGCQPMTAAMMSC